MYVGANVCCTDIVYIVVDIEVAAVVIVVAGVTGVAVVSMPSMLMLVMMMLSLLCVPVCRVWFDADIVV